MHPAGDLWKELDAAAKALEHLWHPPWLPFRPPESVWTDDLVRRLWNQPRPILESVAPHLVRHPSFAIRAIILQLVQERRYGFGRALARHALVRDPEMNVRAIAARALALIGHQDDLDLLLDTKDSEHAEVKKGIVIALRALGDARCVPLLTRWVGRAEADDELRALAADALGALRDDAALPVLQRLLLDTSLSLRVRLLAAKALGSIGGPLSFDLLVQGLHRSERRELRAAAAAALGRTGEPRARAVLSDPALLAEIGEVEAGALEGLCHAGDRHAEERLKARVLELAASCAGPYLRAAAALRGRAALDAALQRRSEDEDAHVRASVRAAIEAQGSV